MQYAIVTGASKGIGRCMCYELAKRGHNLILVARSEDLLKELTSELSSEFNINVEYYATDLLKNENLKNLYSWCTDNNYEINILINNAGFGLKSNFETVDIDRQNDMIQLNVSTLVYLTRLFVPLLQKNERSYILNVGSVASLFPIPYFSVYPATKAFVLSFSRTLRYELKKFNISVSCLCPGVTKTEFFDVAGSPETNNQPFAATPEEVAKAAIDGMFKSKEIIFPKFNNKLLSLMSKIIPHKLIIESVGKSNKI